MIEETPESEKPVVVEIASETSEACPEKSPENKVAPLLPSIVLDGEELDEVDEVQMEKDKFKERHRGREKDRDRDRERDREKERERRRVKGKGKARKHSSSPTSTTSSSGMEGKEKEKVRLRERTRSTKEKALGYTSFSFPHSHTLAERERAREAAEQAKGIVLARRERDREHARQTEMWQAEKDVRSTHSHKVSLIFCLACRTESLPEPDVPRSHLISQRNMPYVNLCFLSFGFRVFIWPLARIMTEGE